MSDKNTFWTRIVPIAVAIVLGLFGSGAGLFNLLESQNENEVSEEIRIAPYLPSNTVVGGFYIDAVWEHTYSDTIQFGNFEPIIKKRSDSRDVKRLYVISEGDIPSEKWVEKYFKPNWPDKDLYELKFIYNSIRVKDVKTGAGPPEDPKE